MTKQKEQQALQKRGLLPKDKDAAGDFNFVEYADRLENMSAEELEQLQIEIEDTDEDNTVDVVFSDDTGGTEDVYEDDEEEDVSKETSDTSKSSSAEEASETDPKRSKDRGSRRIQSLVERTKELEKKLEEAQNAVASRENLNASNALSTQDARVDSLKSKLDLVRFKIKEAREAGEPTDDLNDELIELRIDLKVEEARRQSLAAQKENPKLAQTPQREPTPAASPNIPETVQEFIKENTWVTEPKTKDERRLRAEALRLAREYEVDLRYDMSDPATFDDIGADLRLFAKNNNLVVEGFSEPQKTTKQKKSPSVAGSNLNSSSGKIVVSKDDVAFMESLGITDRTMQIEYVKKRAARDKNPTGWR